MIEAFEELMDQLYWSGFAQKLLEDEPERYQWELNEFFKTYQ